MQRTWFAAAWLAGAAVSSATAQQPVRTTLDTYTLPNGLQVILAEDHNSQVVSVNVWYRVGSRDEVKGRTGFAHLFEHMMFQGSAHVKKAEHFQLIMRAGGQTDGTTSEDRTAYYETLPSNRLNLGLWLEADRMRSLAIADSTFVNQREAVKEERRLRVDNQPYAAVLFEGFYALQDTASCFSYAHSVIGSMDDLNAAKTSDVQAFFDLYYAPNNATLVVAGDFDKSHAKRLVEEYFGGIPRGKEPPPVRCDVKFNTGQIRRRWPDQKATLPAVTFAYRVPEYANADYPALFLLAGILGQGESSRLNRTVVREQKLAQGAFGGLNLGLPRRGPGYLFVFAVANQGVSPDSIERAIVDQVSALTRDGVTDAELTKAKNQDLAQRLQGQQVTDFLADAIQVANLFLGDPALFYADVSRYEAVTIADIKRVAAKYLVPDNSLVYLVTPEAAR